MTWAFLESQAPQALRVIQVQRVKEEAKEIQDSLDKEGVRGERVHLGQKANRGGEETRE